MTDTVTQGQDAPTTNDRIQSDRCVLILQQLSMRLKKTVLSIINVSFILIMAIFHTVTDVIKVLAIDRVW